MDPNLLSLREVTAIERAYTFGVPSLGKAASELLRRWKAGLRDSETFTRLAFLSSYATCEPTWLTGLVDPLPSVESLLEEAGGVAAVSPEGLFVLAYLAQSDPEAMGDGGDWAERAPDLFRAACQREPSSDLFANWEALLRPDVEPRGLRLKNLAEVHARFDGRGALGHYFEGILPQLVNRMFQR